jgi:pSer/pThr/pTyr-binding forkhead associated (FHA) protein
LILDEANVKIRDLRSKNGTLVNGDSIAGDVELKTGDKLKVGPLEFEVIIDHSLGGAKRPKVEGVDAVVRATANKPAAKAVEDLDVASWLDEADEADRIRRSLEPETRQFMLDETERIELEKVSVSETQVGQATSETVADEPKEAPKKKEPKKLPPRPTVQAKDTREAAADTLKKLFTRR